MIRCYNCGKVGHRTQQCTEYGPYYLEPGKTSQDYAKLVQHIADLFAADIITEHQAGHGDQPQIEAEGSGLSAATTSAGTGDRTQPSSDGD